MARFNIRHLLIITGLIAVEFALLIAISPTKTRGTMGPISPFWFALPWLIASGSISKTIYSASSRLTPGGAVCVGMASVTFVQAGLVVVWLLSAGHR